MSLDQYVTLGRSGLRVSPFCLGAMTFGGDDMGWGATRQESTAIIDRYLELGGNFIDTANLYTQGRSETILGEHLGAKRDRLVIATKFSGNLHPGDPNGGGSNRKSVIAACEASLKRLKTDYIDLYWLHNWDKHTPIEETMATLHTLVESGKVRYIGVSDTPAWKVTQAQMIAQMRGWAPFIGLQIEYSLRERTVEGELVPMAQELGLGITPWSPLAGGVLSGKYTRQNAGTLKSDRGEFTSRHLGEPLYALVDALAKIAGELDTTVARVALAWVQGRPGVTSTILGVRTTAQLDDNVKALGVSLTADHVASLDALSKPTLDFPAEILTMTPLIHAGGTTVNGEVPPRNPLVEELLKSRKPAASGAP